MRLEEAQPSDVSRRIGCTRGAMTHVPQGADRGCLFDCSTGCVPVARTAPVVSVPGMSYPSGLTDRQWELLAPVFNAPGNGTWAQALSVLYAAARQADGRAEETPSMVVIDTHLARGASNGIP